PDQGLHGAIHGAPVPPNRFGPPCAGTTRRRCAWRAVWGPGAMEILGSTGANCGESTGRRNGRTSPRCGLFLRSGGQCADFLKQRRIDSSRGELEEKREDPSETGVVPEASEVFGPGRRTS